MNPFEPPMLYEAREIGDEPLGQVAIVEVLGDGADERHRAGRTVMEIRGGGLQIMREYRLDQKVTAADHAIFTDAFLSEGV